MKKKLATFTFRVTDDLKDAAIKKAGKAGISVAELVRRTIEEHLREENTDPEETPNP